MDTPYLPQSHFGQDFENVYEPAEDSFLLLDALEKDLESLKTTAWTCLECGSGSGVVITALSKALSSSNRLMLATDINPYACRTTIKCARFHGLSNLNVIQTNLAESLVDRLENCVDLLIFNPPYVPTEDSELNRGHLHRSWAGGSEGRNVTDIFLKSFVPRLLSKPDGVAYLVALDKNSAKDLTNCLVPFDINGSIVMERKAGIEQLFIIKYSRPN